MLARKLRSSVSSARQSFASVGFGLAVAAAAGLAMVAAPHRAAAETTITYWTFIDPTQDNPRGRNLAGQIERFEEANPDITVEVEVLPWHQIAAQMVQATAAGRTPDVARVLGWDLPTLVAAGSITGLNQFTDKWSEEEKADFIVDWDATVWGGEKMAIPYEHRVPVLWYREDLLEKAGLEVPKTIDQMIAVGKALNGMGNVQGMVIGLSRASQASALAEWFMPMLWAHGGELLDDSGKPAFNGEAGVETLMVIKRLVDEGAMPKSVVGYTYEEVFQGVKAGTIAMNVLGSHRVVTAREAGGLGDNLQTAPLPGETADGPTPAHVFGWNLVIGKDSEHPEAAWKFIEHMTSAESQIITAKTTGELPTRSSAYEDAFFQGPEAEEVRMWKAYMEEYGFAPKYPENYVELSQLIADAAQEVVLRGADPKEALDRAAERYMATQ